MSWVRFVPGFSRHPKRLQSSTNASWLWVCSIDFCTEQLTNGEIPHAVVASLCPNLSKYLLNKAIKELVRIGSWELTEDGYRIHDYLRHNSSKSQVEDDREQARRRYHRWHDQRHDNAVANALDHSSPTPLETAKQRRSNETMVGRSVGQIEQTPSKKTRGPDLSRQRPHGSDQPPDAFKKSSGSESPNGPRPSGPMAVDWLDSLAKASGISRAELEQQIADERAKRTQS